VTGVVIFISVFNECITLAVDSVVGQMHEQVLQVLLGWAHVLMRGEARQTFFEHEDAKGVNTQDEYINAQVELQAVDQVRFSHVALCNQVVAVFRVDVFKTTDQVDASALAHVCWLYDERFALFRPFRVELLLQVV